MKKVVYTYLFVLVSLLGWGMRSAVAAEMQDSVITTANGDVFVVIDTTTGLVPSSLPPLAASDFRPDPAKATWYALVCPGLGQIYNRSYWKVPVLYGGIATLSYLIVWNGRMYNDYKNAYHDIMDTDPTTNSYMSLVPNRADYGDEWMKSALKKRRDMYRRYRDLSIFGMAALYVVSVVDAFVDAHLYDFSVSDDLSLRVEPYVNPYGSNKDGMEMGSSVYGFQCSISF
ncbi:MAG: DUF5683 domain-containing protein [Paludibacteraceae bacterium]|nr:DUF5683 domain-containing protein [Paludibacteraceae bacterium]